MRKGIMVEECSLAGKKEGLNIKSITHKVVYADVLEMLCYCAVKKEG